MTYVTRKVSYITTMNSSLVVSPFKLSVKDGAKILSLRIQSLGSRTLTVEVPNGTAFAVNTGTAIAPFGGFRKMVVAPLSRLPTIKINIPDLLAAPLNADSTETLFSAFVETTGDIPVRIMYTAKYLA